MIHTWCPQPRPSVSALREKWRPSLGGQAPSPVATGASWGSLLRLSGQNRVCKTPKVKTTCLTFLSPFRSHNDTYCSSLGKLDNCRRKQILGNTPDIPAKPSTIHVALLGIARIAQC